MSRKLPILLVAVAVATVVAAGAVIADATGTTDPSGAAMPTAPSGYRTVLASNFSGNKLPGCWEAYTANPISSSPTGAWLPSHVTVGGGMAVLSAYYDSQLGKWASGGMSSWRCVSLHYGIVEVRFKMAAAQGVKYVMLLWPAKIPWPDGGEIDFAEDRGGNRSHTTLSSIYGVNGVEKLLPPDLIAGDFARWNTIKLVWTKGSVVDYLNGKRVASTTSPEVPSDHMTFDIQTETNTNCSYSYTCINSTTPPRVDLDVDWAVVFAPTSH